jgi:polygalacturonase
MNSKKKIIDIIGLSGCTTANLIDLHIKEEVEHLLDTRSTHLDNHTHTHYTLIMKKINILTFIFILGIGMPVFAQWSTVNTILKNIKPPTFPNKNYSVVDFGAKNDSTYNSRLAVNKAITVCSNEGGGKVIVPRGNYFIAGPIILKSYVNLELEEGAIVNFSGTPVDYMPMVLTVWEGVELFNYSPLIYAYHVTDIAITGKGIFNGNASKCFANYRPQKSKQQYALRQMGIDQVPVFERNFGKESILPPSMLQFFGCRNILIEGITLKDSPYWVVHPVFCNNVTVRKITIDSYNLNNDGCDPEFTTNVLIENCVFNCGDDAIAIKAGRDQDAWRVGQPTENIIIRNCLFNSKCNGLCIGSEMAAGVRNVYMENVKIKNCLSGIYFKSNLDRGGYIKNVYVRNIECDSVRSALIRFENNYFGGRGGFYPTLFQNFLIENIKGDRSGECGFYGVGVKNYPLKNIKLKNIYLRQCRTPYIIRNVENVTFENVELGGIKVQKSPAETESKNLSSF